MSPNDRNMSGIKGKRIPGRPGRFDPSEPLHMTTRRAAKTGTANDSPSLNGSAGDSESRRGSLDDMRPRSSRSSISQRSVKSRRPSDVSVHVAAPDADVNGLPSSEEKSNGMSISKPSPPILKSPSPSRKRKRSTGSPTAIVQPTNYGQIPDGIFTLRYEDNDIVLPSDVNVENEGDTLEVVHPDNMSDRLGSQRSSQSDDEMPQHGTFTAQSMDITPAESGPVSPATSESGSPEDLPLAKPLDVALGKLAQNAEGETAEGVEDVDVDGDMDMEGADDGDDQAQSYDDERPRRRFGGRRRAQHPIPEVEKAMQRQAELKSAYRAIARAQKAVLAELAQRAVEDLETNPNLHAEAVEWQGVKTGLENSHSRRQYQTRTAHELKLERLKQTLEGEARMRKAKCDQQIEAYQDELITKVEHAMLSIARAAQVEGIDIETEDEDDVIPKLKGQGYRWKRTDPLDDHYDSRSRIPVESARALSDMDWRLEMRKMLEAFDGDEKFEQLHGGFTVMDRRPHEAASAKRDAERDTNTLALAAKEVERLSRIPVIPNEQAVGLQLLGDLAMRPSISAASREASLARQGPDSSADMTPSKPMPPHLKLQTHHNPSPIPVEMSPRTTQALNDRLEHSMPPPTTPRQGGTPLLLRNANIATTGFRRPPSTSETIMEFSNPSPGRHRPSEHKQAEPFLPSPVNDRRIDLPLWREYPRPQGGRLLSRPVSFSLSGTAPFREDRQANSDFRPQGGREAQDAIKQENVSPSDQFRGGSTHWSAQPHQPDALSARQRQGYGTGLSRKSTMGLQLSPRFGASPISFSAHNFQREKSPRSYFAQKPKKIQRDGLSRRQWSDENKAHRKFNRSSGSKSESAGSPTNVSPSLAPGAPDPSYGAGMFRTQPPSQRSPLGPPPPPAGYQQSPYCPPPAQPNYTSGQQGYDYYQHRSSFPPPPPSSSWDSLPPTPLYSVPQHPPPPGVPAEQFHRPFAPPPPPGYQPPPLQQHTSQPQSAPGTYGQHQFGGPTLAPAVPQYHHKPGFRPGNHPPAFAQQAQQHQQSNNSRRRTQSDASNFTAKFHPWNPPNGRR